MHDNAQWHESQIALHHEASVAIHNAVLNNRNQLTTQPRELQIEAVPGVKTKKVAASACVACVACVCGPRGRLTRLNKPEQTSETTAHMKLT